MVGNDVGVSSSLRVFAILKDTGGSVGKGADPGGRVGRGADPGGSVGKGADPGGRVGGGADPGGRDDSEVGLYVGTPLPDVAMGGFENGVGAPVVDVVPGGNVGEVASPGSSVARSRKSKK